jgi:shikimate kinase/3-dehydroquinate synthase
VERPRPLFLIGFMAAGKTSVGQELARQTGRRFIDLDDVIAAMGEPVATLVARDEPEFRRREAAALQQVIAAGGDPIVATGGGAAAHADNLERMRAAGCVVALHVEAHEAVRRAGGGPPRPLLAQAAELYVRRTPIYRRAHAVIDTTARTIENVVERVRYVERFGDDDGTVIVELGARTYQVNVHGGERFVFVSRAGKAVVITDHNVAQHCRDNIPKGVPIVAIEPGEASKSFATYERLCNELVALGLDRTSMIFALGGGVVGDLAGFVAATLFRGIPIIQLPTTLVAMVDSAIGGKTAIDLPAGKNLVGAFHQPVAVECNLRTLQTLPDRERRAGFGELWKYALLDGPDLWQAVDASTSWAGDGGEPPERLRYVIRACIAYKAAIVSRDERETTGVRALLNLGHTVGHAIESASGLHHGEAVGLGLIAACRVSAALGMAPASLEAEVIGALRRTGLPADLAPYLTDDVLARLQVDKKRIGGNLRFIAVREVGACEPVEVPVTELQRILRGQSAP